MQNYWFVLVLAGAMITVLAFYKSFETKEPQSRFVRKPRIKKPQRRIDPLTIAIAYWLVVGSFYFAGPESRSNINMFVILLSLVLAALFASFAFLWTKYQNATREIEEAQRRFRVNLSKSLSTPNLDPTPETINAKKEKFLNVPSISFHFANQDQIRSFYADYFREPTIESMVSEIAGELSGEIKGSIPQVLESRLGTKDVSKWVSTIKLPDIPLSGMFQRYQRETIRNAQVTLGIEEVDIELTELQAFNEAVDNMAKRFDFSIEVTALEVQRARLKEKAAERTLIRLEQVTGWVLIEGLFKIQPIEGGFYQMTYLHPVKEYLPTHVGPVTISVLVQVQSIESHVAGNYAQSIGKQIPLRIYGQVWRPISRKNQEWDLQLIPLAIY